MPAQMHTAHRAGLVEMRKGTFQAFTALAQESLAPGPADAPAVPVDRVTGRGLAAPVPPSAIGFREVGAHADRLQVHQHLIAVIPLVANQLAYGVGRLAAPSRSAPRP